MFTNMQRHMLRHIVLLCHWVTADGCVVRSHRRIRRQSSRIHVHTADADATRFDSFVSSASAVCIGLKIHFITRSSYIQDRGRMGGRAGERMGRGKGEGSESPHAGNYFSTSSSGQSVKSTSATTERRTSRFIEKERHAHARTLLKVVMLCWAA